MFTLFLLLNGASVNIIRWKKEKKEKKTRHFPQYGILISPYYGQHFNAMELAKTMEIRFSSFFYNIPKIEFQSVTSSFC